MKIFIDKELFQWERNRYVILEVKDDEAAPDFVQFYNARSTRGPEVPLIDGRAKIPDELLQSSLPITAVACRGKKGSAKVITRREFKVIKRVRPENYQDTPPDDEDDEDYYIIYDGGEET